MDGLAQLSSNFTLLVSAAGLLMMAGCRSSAADFETLMRTPLPASVTVEKMDGNWGADPWRCWELSPADDELRKALITRWKLAPDPKAFHGVASGGQIYCRYDDLFESYSGNDDSYRAVGIDVGRNILVVYFYNG
jgi:hypothetical protein